MTYKPTSSLDSEGDSFVGRIRFKCQLSFQSTKEIFTSHVTDKYPRSSQWCVINKQKGMFERQTWDITALALTHQLTRNQVNGSINVRRIRVVDAEWVWIVSLLSIMASLSVFSSLCYLWRLSSLSSIFKKIFWVTQNGLRISWQMQSRLAMMGST